MRSTQVLSVFLRVHFGLGQQIIEILNLWSKSSVIPGNEPQTGEKDHRQGLVSIAVTEYRMQQSLVVIVESHLEIITSNHYRTVVLWSRYGIVSWSPVPVRHRHDSRQVCGSTSWLTPWCASSAVNSTLILVVKSSRPNWFNVGHLGLNVTISRECKFRGICLSNN